MIVVDASVALEVLLRLEPAETCELIEARLFAPGATLHAPHLLDLEVAQVVRRLAARGEIDEERGRAALIDLVDLPIRRWPHTVLLPRVWELRRSLTAYDAAYLALAEALDAVLITRDRGLASAGGPARVAHV